MSLSPELEARALKMLLKESHRRENLDSIGINQISLDFLSESFGARYIMTALTAQTEEFERHVNERVGANKNADYVKCVAARKLRKKRASILKSLRKQMPFHDALICWMLWAGDPEHSLESAIIAATTYSPTEAARLYIRGVPSEQIVRAAESGVDIQLVKSTLS